MHFNEDMIVEVIGLPQIEEKWFKTNMKKCKEMFMRLGDKELEIKNQVIICTSLSEPWGEVAYYLISYFTSEGWDQYIFSHHLKLLSHLRYKKLVNMSFYMSRSIHAMSLN